MAISLGRLAASLLASALLVSCAARQPPHETTIGGHPIAGNQINAEWVRAGTTATRRGNKIVFSAPVLRLTQLVDPKSGGAPGPGTGQLQTARSGYLLGEQDMGTLVVKHFLVFQWDLVEGQNRYARVALADGRPLRFQVGDTAPPGSAGTLPVIQTLIVEVPEEALRLVPPAGLRLTMTLDNGVSFQVAPPQAYVRGYLQAVDAGR